MGHISVGELLGCAGKRLGLVQNADHRYIFSNSISRSDVQRCIKDELFVERLKPHVVIILSQKDQGILKTASTVAREALFKNIVLANIPCIILSQSPVIPEFLSHFAISHRVTILSSQFDEYLLASRLRGVLREKIDRTLIAHAALINVHDIGVMITGESGTGKTMCALRLAMEGHSWIADDVVRISKSPGGVLYGRSHVSVRNLLEIKNVGIMDARYLLGKSRVREKTRVDFVVKLGMPEDNKSKENGHGYYGDYDILDVKLPCLCLPANYDGIISSRKIDFATTNFVHGGRSS